MGGGWLGEWCDYYCYFSLEFVSEVLLVEGWMNQNYLGKSLLGDDWKAQESLRQDQFSPGCMAESWFVKKLLDQNMIEEDFSDQD